MRKLFLRFIVKDGWGDEWFNIIIRGLFKSLILNLYSFAFWLLLLKIRYFWYQYMCFVVGLCSRIMRRNENILTKNDQNLISCELTYPTVPCNVILKKNYCSCRILLILLAILNNVK